MEYKHIILFYVMLLFIYLPVAIFEDLSSNTIKKIILIRYMVIFVPNLFINVIVLKPKNCPLI